MYAPLDIFLKSGFVTKGVFSTCVTFGTGGYICTNKAASDWVTTAPSRVDFCGFIWEVGLEEDAMHLQYTPDKSGPEIWWRVQEKLVVHLFLVLQHLVGFLLLLWWHNVILIKRLCVAHFRQLFQANITAAGFCAKLKQCHWRFAQTFFLNPNPCQKKTWFTPEIMGSLNRQPSQGIQCWLLWLCSKGVALWGEC